jgi:hypothetical protein
LNELGCHPEAPESRIKRIEDNLYENDRLKVEREEELQKAMDDPKYGFNSKEK